TLARRAPCHQEVAVLVELHHARIDVAVGHEESSVRKKREIGWPAEMVLIVAGDTRLAERQHELLAVVCELEDLLSEIVDDPHMLFGIVRTDFDLVWTAAALKEPIPLRPCLDELAVRVDDDDAVA